MLVDRAIFLESTLSQEEINPYLKKSDLLLPSITRGQLVKLYTRHPEVKEVVIVDGVFEQSPSITHKEILWLLSKGVKIVGMGSMGALRAYELRNNGMQGYGWVYDQFLNQCVEGDDEVAVAYDPLNPAKSKTLALINFRKVIEKHGEFANYLTIIRRIHYRERTWSALSLHLPSKIIESLYDKYIDIKKEDVLNFIKGPVQISSQSQVKFIPNVYFNSLYFSNRNVSVIQFIRIGLQKIHYKEFIDNTVYQEECSYICRFLGLSLDYINQAAYVLNLFSGIRLSKSKIKAFTVIIRSELSLHTPQSVQDLFTKIEIPLEKINSLLENLTKLFDYFLCTSY
ncbi:hypothetical protein ELY21_02335 [Legionella sp. km535]|uniref:TfuA-like protein n=1 Tax=Legionella sp. km535 TaxID=2498107 RepID=UPI000F8DC0C0|nr:TfuA-like protein [Legionella sp. km535]RUR19916.1 hypothetical protein ELY21_02335 [Legionella sp. km535]